MKCSLHYEHALWNDGVAPVAGIDEAGRGPLAGPVVAAAVILPRDFKSDTLTDSKQLTERQRERLFLELTADPAVCHAAAIIDHDEIDRINILRATHEAMRRAFAALTVPPQHALIDGLPLPHFPVPHTAIVKGDAQSLSIAAASVIAKVTRDRIMLELDALHPEYGFARHKGYGTALHLSRLQTHGPSPVHRKTFLPVARQLALL